jgi:hypothetical protein
VKNWSRGERLYGTALDFIPVGAFGIVQFGGIVQLPIDQDNDILFDDTLELDANGMAVKRFRGTAIGYARGRSDYANNLLKVKLL